MRTLVLLLLPTVASAQTYIDRATMGTDQVFISRVGVAAQQQSIIVEGEAPDTCCQTTTQMAMASTSGKQTVKSLCDVILPPGSTTAPDTLKLQSRQRHDARGRFNRQVIANASQWARQLAPIIASDPCIPLDVTDATIQSYMLRLWDVMALPPELATAPFVPAAPPPPPTPPGALTAPKRPPGGQP